MRPLVHYLSVEDVKALHVAMMEELGFNPSSLRGGGEDLLAAAIRRPQWAAQYDAASVIRQAALVGVSISQAQAYIDGNKRTAYVALRTFLRLNGYRYSGDAIELAKHLVDVADASDHRDTTIDVFEKWLTNHIEPG